MCLQEPSGLSFYIELLRLLTSLPGMLQLHELVKFLPESPKPTYIMQLVSFRSVNWTAKFGKALGNGERIS